MSAKPDEVPIPTPGALPPEAAARAFESALDADVSEAPGSRIGPYKLLEEIGEGGFGVVWMAEQTEPIRRRVALKIIKSGMDTREVIARFEAERQALALMDHPNIARVFDAGATDSGRPFFVMELVRGVPITRYCDEHRLPAEARLRLFVAVCSAVQHAHQKGVIHRDLKPSNILVTLHDGAAVPKVIDFGIAKATSGTLLTDKTLFTRFHAFIGTPAYTSPEQMEMSSLDVDTRSDIYSLGVLLYELLTGRPPFDANSLLEAGIDAMRRTIREVEPPRPSHRLATLSHNDLSTVAQQRDTDVARLSLLLRGDLDWIVMRCLEKDRARRYETANGLARDIERHLVNEPVFARPPSRSYRLQKFIRRHKAGFTAALAVCVSLVAGLVVSSLLLVREQAARARASDAEQAESRLREQAEIGRDLETKRSSLNAITIADQLLQEGRAADAVAYLVHAARKDPTNMSLGPRLASVLANRNFLIPMGPSVQTSARVLAMRYTNDGTVLLVATADGVMREFDAFTGALRRQTDLGKPIRREGVVFPAINDDVFAVRFEDDTMAVFEVGSSLPRWNPIRLDAAVVPTDGMWRLGAAIQISPDGRWVSARGLREFWLWDGATGEKRLDLKFTRFASGPEFARDSGRFVIATDDAAQMWSLPECEPQLEPIRVDREANNSGRRLIASFSPDGRRLALCDPWEGTEIFDTTTGARLADSKVGIGAFALTTRYVPDGRLFISGRFESLLWNPETGESMALPAELGATDAILSSVDGRLLLATSGDGQFRIWDTVSGKLAAEPALHQPDRFCIAISPGNSQVAIGTSTGAVHRMRLNPGPASPLAMPSTARSLATSFNSRLPASVTRLEEDFSRDFDAASGVELAPEPERAARQNLVPRLIGVKDLNFDIRRDLKFIAVRREGRDRETWERSGPGFVRRTPLEEAGPTARGIGFAFSPAGDRVAQVLGSSLCIWDLHTGRLAGPPCTYLNLELCAYPGIDFSPDGERIAGGISNGEVVVWDVRTGKSLAVIATGSESASFWVKFSPDGTRLLNTNWWHETRLWDSSSGKPLGPVLRSTDANRCEFSDDGRLFATFGPRSIRIWETATCQPVGEPIAFGALELRFAPDGRRIAATQDNAVVRMFEVETGRLVSEPILTEVETTPQFSPDSRFLLTETEDNAASIHSLPPLEETAAPEWLLRLASACGTREIDGNEQCVDAPRAVDRIDEVRTELASLPDDAPFVEWGRWILDESPSRSIAPGFTVTAAAAAELESRLRSGTQ